MRTDLLGGLLDAAALQPRSRRRARRAVRVGARLPAPRRRRRRRAGRRVRGRAPPRRHRAAPDRRGPDRQPRRRDGWRSDRAARRLLHAKGLLEAARGAARGRRSSSSRSTRPFLHPARGAGRRLAGLEAGWLGEVHPSSAATGISTPARRRLRARRSSRARAPRSPATRALRGRHDLSRPSHQDLAIVVERRRTGAERVRGGGARRAAASCCAAPTVFDVYAGEQVGRAARSLALRLEFRAADRTLTDAEVAEAARPSRRARRDRAELRG